MKRLIAVLLVVLLVAGLAACGGGGGGTTPPAGGGDGRQVLEIGVPHSGLMDSPREYGFAAMREYIRYAADGWEIILTTFPANQVGTSIEQIAGVQSGVFDMALQGIAHTGTFQPLVAVLDIPFMIPQDVDDYVALLTAENSPFLEYFYDTLREVGLEPINIWHDGYGYWTASFPASVPADFNGRLIRVMPSPMRVAMVERMGGIMIAMDWMELYNALMTGAVEAQENPWNSSRTAMFHEVQDYMVGTRHVAMDHILLANPTWWAGLAPEVQDAIHRAAAVGTQASMNFLHNTHDAESYEIMFGGDNPYMTLIYPTEAEMELWMELHWLVREDYLAEVGPRGQTLLDLFDAEFTRVTGIERVRPS